MFVHFMPFVVYVCTALLPLGVIKDNNYDRNTFVCVCVCISLKHIPSSTQQLRHRWRWARSWAWRPPVLEVWPAHWTLRAVTHVPNVVYTGSLYNTVLKVNLSQQLTVMGPQWYK